MKYATIGTSMITNEFINAAKEQGKLTLQAVYSRTEEQAKDFAKMHGAPQFYTELEELAKSDIECVYIASPNSMHFEQVTLFLKHKKHVICEKPIFSNRNELDKAFQTADENGVFLFEAMRNLHMPGHLALKEKLSGAGRIRSAVLDYSSYSSRYDKVKNGEVPNIFSLKFSGGALVDLGVYPLAIALNIFGKPEDITYSPTIIETGVDGSGTLILRYPDFICTILCSKISTSYNHSEIQGEEGTFTIDDIGTLANVRFIQSAGETIIYEEQSQHPMSYEIESFVNIMESNDQEKYNQFRKISTDIIEITEKARKTNGIIFGIER